MGEEAERLRGLRDRLQHSLMRRIPGLRINGDTAHRLPGNLNMSFPGLTAPELIETCPSIAISTGSACTSATVEPSYVLVAMGGPIEWAMGAVRHSLGRPTTAEDIDYVVESVEPIVRKLRAAMPVGAA